MWSIINSFISVRNLNFFYNTKNTNSRQALKDINLDINKGEFIAILGNNGCGKSTLIKHLNGLLIPTSGDVIIDGINTKDEEKSMQTRQKIGIIFQNPDNQIVSSIVEEDVAFGPENLGIKREEIIDSIDRALESVGMLNFKKHDIYKLSGGQKQRVAIAGILSMNPEFIVLDEPTSMLDPRGRKEVLDTIINLNKNFKNSIILITHDIEEAFNADRIIIMENGSIISDNPSQEILEDIDYIRSLNLGLTQSMDLIFKLKKFGIKIPSEAVSENKCVKVLKTLLEGKQCL